MVNNDLGKFLKNQKKAERKYLKGSKDNRVRAQSDPEFNNNNDTNMSPGATGRED